MAKLSQKRAGAALPPLPADAYPQDAKPLAVELLPLRAVLSDGPDEMSFCGRQWKRGVPQTVTPELWAQMQARAAERLGFQLLTEES